MGYNDGAGRVVHPAGGGRPIAVAGCCGAAPSTTMRGTPVARFATTTTPTTNGTTTVVGWGGVLLMTFLMQKAARSLPCCWARNAVGLRTHGRGHNRHWGEPARPVPGRSPVPPGFNSGRTGLGRIQNSPGPWVQRLGPGQLFERGKRGGTEGAERSSAYSAFPHFRDPEARRLHFALPGSAIQAIPARLPNPAGAVLISALAREYNNESMDLSNRNLPPSDLPSGGNYRSVEH